MDAGQVSISRTRTLIIWVTVPRISPSLSLSQFYPFTRLPLFLLCHLFSAAFCSEGEKAKNPETKKMTLNPLKGSTEITVWKCQPLPTSPSFSLRLRSLFPPSPYLHLNFFQLRGADSPDTIIWLYCGTATVAAALCKGFPRMARGQSGVSRHGGATEQCRYKGVGGLVTTCNRAPCRAAWQLQFKMLSPFPLVSSGAQAETERRGRAI